MDEFYMNSFWELNTERQIGMGLGPIPSSKITEYGHRVGLDSDNIDLLRAVIRRMDVVYLEWKDEEAERRRRQQGGHGSGKSTR